MFVRRTWFEQFGELYFVLNWLVMRCKLWPELVAEAATVTVGCPLQPEEGLAGILSQLPGKQPSIWKTGHHLQENNNTVLLFC